MLVSIFAGSERDGIEYDGTAEARKADVSDGANSLVVLIGERKRAGTRFLGQILGENEGEA